MTLHPIDEQAAKTLAVRFLNLNSDQLPRNVQTGKTSPAGSSHSAIFKRILLTIVVAFGGLVASFILLAIVTSIIDTEPGVEQSGGETTAILLAFLAGIAIFIALPLWYWKRSGPKNPSPTSTRKPIPVKLKRDDVLSGRATSSAVYEICGDVLARLRMRRQLRESETIKRNRRRREGRQIQTVFSHLRWLPFELIPAG